ncbi:MAG: heat-inducible transcriptional repressor HrcA [Eubacteriales bacterium]|nr:heat-inducible transcriptional repressor HrcA [Eubacteriales bacterium]
MDLSARKKLILKAIISEYIRTAEPVGSKSVASRPELGFSSATIRNEMSELEEMGFLQKTHTSSGRIPSAKGYRLYVDELMGLPDLTSADISSINTVTQLKAKELDRLISEAGRLISDLTNYTTLAVTPVMQRITIRRFEIIAVDNMNFVIVVVTDTGVVKNKMIRTAYPVSADESELLTYVLNQTLTGIPIEAITKERFDIVRRAAGLTALLNPIAEFIEDLIEELGTQKLFLQGASKLLSQPEYRDVAKAQALLDYIGDSAHVPALRRFTREIDGVRITIGPENGVEPLENASMVYATYNIGSVGRGLIGIVGPTRMDYGRLSARLSLFSKGLNKLIAETFFDDIEDENN